MMLQFLRQMKDVLWVPQDRAHSMSTGGEYRMWKTQRYLVISGNGLHFEYDLTDNNLTLWRDEECETWPKPNLCGKRIVEDLMKTHRSCQIKYELIKDE